MSWRSAEAQGRLFAVFAEVFGLKNREAFGCLN
jgi:hypothetical protein